MDSRLRLELRPQGFAVLRITILLSRDGGNNWTRTSNSFRMKEVHYQLCYITMVQPTGIEPVSTILQTAAMTTSARVAWGEGRDSNSQPTESQSAALPLRYQHH